MKQIVVYFFLVLFANTLFAQTQTIDSLNGALKILKEDTNKVKTLNNLSRELFKISDYEKALQISNTALALSNKIGFKKGLALTYIQIGRYHYNKSNFTQSLIHFRDALKYGTAIKDPKIILSAYANIATIYLEQGNYSKALQSNFEALKSIEKMDYKTGVASLYNNIGNVYYYQENYPEALKNYFIALKLREKIDAKYDIVGTYSNIGSVYVKKNDYMNALKYFLASQKVAEEIGDKKDIATVYNNIGNIYFNKKDFAVAAEKYNASLKIAKELGDIQAEANAYENIGNVYVEQGKHQEALKNFLYSLKLTEEIGDKNGITISFLNLSGLYSELKKYKKAETYALKALSLAKETGSSDNIKDAYEMLSDIYTKTKRYKEALEYHLSYIALRDNIFNEENTKKAVQIQMQYDFDKKETAAKLDQEKKDAIQQEEIRRQRTVRNSFIAGFGLMLLLAVTVFLSYRQKQKANVLLTLQKREIEHKNEELNRQNEEIASQRDQIEEQKYKVEEHQKEIIDSITYAKRLQEAILPPSAFWQEQLKNSFILYKPKDIVAGDFYWMENVGDMLLFAAADCTGHGVPGAMVSVVCSNALNRTVKEFKITEPGKVLDKVRSLVIETFERSESEVKDGMDISLCCINKKTNELQWAGANNPLWLIKNNQLQEVKADKQPIGKYAEQKPFTTHHFQLEGGDGIYLFTDGYADQFGGPKGKKFKYKQLEDLLLSNSALPLSQQSVILNQNFEAWKGSLEQIDDVCIIGVKI